MKRSRFSERQIVEILKEADAGLPANEVWRKHGISSATYHIYGRRPRGKKVSGPGLAMIDCKHPSGVTILWCAQMGHPLTLASTSGRPRGPL